MLDVLKPLDHKRIIERELEAYGIRYSSALPVCVCCVCVCVCQLVQKLNEQARRMTGLQPTGLAFRRLKSTAFAWLQV